MNGQRYCIVKGEHLLVNNVTTAQLEEIGVVSGSVAGKSLTNMEKETKEKKKWVFIEDDDDDSMKNRPEWCTEKERDNLRFNPAPPNPLEDWINKK